MDLLDISSDDMFGSASALLNSRNIVRASQGTSIDLYRGIATLFLPVSVDFFQQLLDILT